MSDPGVAARRLAIEAVRRIDEEGAYANLLLPDLLARSDLDQRDRAFATTVVYGTTRMRRAVGWMVERFLIDSPPPTALAALHVGAYQLAFLDTPAHAAVSATVSAAPKRYRGLCNAVLRKVARSLPGPNDWPDEPTRLSYPDWIVERLSVDLGPERAIEALTTMNRPPAVTVRDDGYTQDLASQWVAEAVGAGPDQLVADLCAAPGGKATALAGTGAVVLAGDRRLGRARLVVDNAKGLAMSVGEGLVGAQGGGVVLAFCSDVRQPPLRDASMDRVLVDAPCSGLGTLRRRPDARWRIQPGDVANLATLQCEALAAAAQLLKPGGVLVYSVCTLSEAETLGVDDWAVQHLGHLEAVVPPGSPWQPWGRGALLLPQDVDTDGMFLLALRAPDELDGRGGSGSAQ